MVWIHGGAFFMGDPDFDGGKPDLLLEEDVIIAAVHYRVGLFGFLSTGDSIVPGNNGLKDQILALQWIKNNIENFGGDPQKITIFGQSAGSASVAYLLQASQTKGKIFTYKACLQNIFSCLLSVIGLYSGAIMLSGSSLDSWSLTRNPLDFTKKISSYLKLKTKNNKDMIESLKKVSVEQIQKATVATFKSVSKNNKKIPKFNFL